MMRRRPSWPVLVLVAAMIMAACGGNTKGTQGARSSPSPTARSIDDGCPAPYEDGEALPASYQPVGDAIQGDLRGDGRASRATILGDEERPPRCRYFLVVEDPADTDPYAPIEAASSLTLDVPSLLMAVGVDGEPGLEVIVNFGGPMHPHRAGQIFTFDEGSLVAMRTERPQFEGGTPILFPLHAEFAGGVDCAGEPGAIVVTSADLAEGGADDSRYEVTRTFYRAQGGLFVAIRREAHTVEVGTERERWPELADEPFRSCSGAA